MTDCRYEFAIQMLSDEGAPLGRSPVEQDWTTVVEHVHFEAIRSGTLPPTGRTPSADVEPAWDRDRGRPWVEGLRVTVRGDDGTASSAEIPVDHFVSEARSAAARLVERGALRAGETYRYRVSAEPRAGAAEVRRAGGAGRLEEIVAPLPIGEKAIGALLGTSRPVGVDAARDELPVFLPHRVIEEARAQVRAAGAVETGGVLLGRLHRDPGDSGGLFVELTAQVPVRHADHGETQLTLTPETWAAARAAVDLRAAGESMMGWWHSHPNWCRDCPAESQTVCRLRRIFFSADDVAVHRTVFSRAWQVALLLSDRPPAGIVPTLFGWRRGLVAARGFHLVGPPGDDRATGAHDDIHIGGTEDARQPGPDHPH